MANPVIFITRPNLELTKMVIVDTIQAFIDVSDGRDGIDLAQEQSIFTGAIVYGDVAVPVRIGENFHVGNHDQAALILLL